MIKGTLIAATLFTCLTTTGGVTAEEMEMKLTIKKPDGLYDSQPNGYSQVVIAPGDSHVAYISGQGGAGIDGTLSPDFEAQVKQTFANLRIALEDIGASPSQVAKIDVFVVDHDMSKLPIMGKYIDETFGGTLPAQTLVPVPRLVLDGMLFEVDAVAILEN